MKRLFLIDAYALIYRSYLPLWMRNGSTQEGLNTSTMLGLSIPLSNFQKWKPPISQLRSTWKGQHSGTERMFESYKTNRDEMPEDIRKSIPYVREIIKDITYTDSWKEGFEADDVINYYWLKLRRDGLRFLWLHLIKIMPQLVSRTFSCISPNGWVTKLKYGVLSR